MAQGTENDSEASPNDAIGNVLGPHHSRRVRYMGIEAAPINTFRYTHL